MGAGRGSASRDEVAEARIVRVRDAGSARRQGSPTPTKRVLARAVCHATGDSTRDTDIDVSRGQGHPARMRGRRANQTSGREGATAYLYRMSYVVRPPCCCINTGQGACGQGGAECVTGDSRCVPLAACERCRFIRESAAYKDDSGAWFAYLSRLCGRRAVAFPQGSWALLMRPMSCRCAAATTGSYGIGGELTS
jgi:hypothetical protein